MMRRITVITLAGALGLTGAGVASAAIGTPQPRPLPVTTSSPVPLPVTTRGPVPVPVTTPSPTRPSDRETFPTVVPGRTPLVGTRWVAEASIEDGQVVTPDVDDPDAYVVFEEPDRVAGYDSCNSISGEAVVLGSRITFGNLISTKRACPADGNPLEGPVHQVLSGTVTYRIAAGRLYLSHPDGLVLVLRADAGTEAAA